jgi:hypothetical protein
MPALEALNDRLRAAHTLPCGISIDTTFCHAAWADQLGGISLPLISDFHPKGEIAKPLGVYLDDRGITDRATIILDAAGTVRHAHSVGPSGVRDMPALVAECEAIDATWKTELPADTPPLGLESSTVLYVRNNCTFSRWAIYARHNLHLDNDELLPVRNVSFDLAAKADLERLGGKAQAPALAVGDVVMYESAEIAAYLRTRASWVWP